MAEISVSAAVSLVEMVLSSLRLMENNQKNVQSEVANLGVCLHRLDAYLADMDGNEGSEQLKERVKEIRDVAYHIEDVLEEFMFNVPHRFHRHRISDKFDELAYAVKLWNPLSSVHELVSKKTAVKREIKTIVDLDQLGFPSSSIRMDEGSSGSKSYHQVAPDIPRNEEIVGFEELGEALILQLTNQGSRNMTISVVDPGGSGKTTIVNNVYESKRIRRQFDCRAWIQVSQPFNIEELICSMLKQFCESREEPIRSEGTIHGLNCRTICSKKGILLF